MKIVVFFTVVLFASMFPVLGQDNYGFYGKKTYLEFSASMYSPILYNLTEYKGFKVNKSGDDVVSGNDWFNIGVRVSLGRAFSSSFGVNLEAGIDEFTYNRPVFGNFEYLEPNDISRHESIRVRSFIFLPRIEFSGPNGLLPYGLVHQFGVGVNVNNVVRDDYLIVYSDGTTSLTNPIDPELLLEEYGLDQTFYALQLLYGFKLRVPLTKWLMIHYGLRLTVDFGGYPSGMNINYMRGVNFQLNNFLAFDLGFTVPF